MEKLYPIGELCKQTGVLPVTIRAWERRYGLLTPTRSEKGHRFYSDSDIAKIKKILDLIKRGVSINRAAELFKETATEPAQVAQTKSNHWQTYVERMLQAIEGYDQKYLDHIYTEILSLYPIETVTEQLLIPMLKTFSERWQLSYRGAISEERFFSTFLRNKLGARFHHLMTHTTGKKLVFSCLPGRHHEFPLLLFALYIMSRGYDVVFLGADVPIEEAFITAEKTGNHGLVFEGHLNQKNYREINKFSKQNCPIFWRGKNDMGEDNSLNSSEVICLTDNLSDNFDLLKQHIY
jgi:DNA-binding transcriptional MerR regulator